MAFRGVAKVVYNLVLWPFVLVLRLVPRSGKRWVFGGGGSLRFADNAAWFYLWVLQQRPDLGAVWVTRSGTVLRRLRAAGLPVRREWSLAGLWAQVHADVAVLSHGPGDVFFPAVSKAFVVNLWHGLPIKHIQLDHPGDRAIMRPSTWLGKVAQGLRRPGLQRGPDLLLAMTPAGRTRMEHAAGLPPDRSSDAGSPRLQAFTASAPRWPFADDVGTIARLRGSATFCVVLLPTWGTDAAVRAMLLGPTVREWLARNEAVLVVKPHPNDPPLELDGADGPIRIAPRELDATLLMAQADILVTDISSAIVDMLAAGRPVVLTPTAWAHDRRGQYQDPAEFVGTAPVQDSAGLVRALEQALRLRRAGRSNASLAAKRWLPDDLEDSCARVAAEIEDRRLRPR